MLGVSFPFNSGNIALFPCKFNKRFISQQKL